MSDELWAILSFALMAVVLLPAVLAVREVELWFERRRDKQPPAE